MNNKTHIYEKFEIGRTNRKPGWGSLGYLSDDNLTTMMCWNKSEIQKCREWVETQLSKMKRPGWRRIK